MTFAKRVLILIGVFAAVMALIFVTRPAPSFATSGPLGLAYRTGAHAAAPVIYKFTVNDRTLFSPAVADFGASKVPPVGSGTIVTSVPRLAFPDDTILDIELEWTEVWTGRQYAVQTRLNEDLYPWFEGDGLQLDITFEQHGGLVMRVISKERWQHAMAMTGSGLPTLSDYPVAFQTCAPLSDTPIVDNEDVQKILGTIFGVDIKRLAENRDVPLPAPRCPEPSR